MSKNNTSPGFAIAIAWPQTYCKQPGAWYDSITTLLGINHNNYYKVGHAALVLIDSTNLKAHYFDFGRYHSPYQHGRVRSAKTDDELDLKTIPRLNKNATEIENYKEILLELQSNAGCHGEGELHASYCAIHFTKAYTKVQTMLESEFIPYGPFRANGSNCSRFVNSAILAGHPAVKMQLKLRYKLPFTPTPISNVRALQHQVIIPKVLKTTPFTPLKKLNKVALLGTLPVPEKPATITENAQWISGEGAGSWFVIELNDTFLKVARYSEKGVLECSGFYQNQKAIQMVQKSKTFWVTYPSNCNVVTLLVNDVPYRFKRTA